MLQWSINKACRDILSTHCFIYKVARSNKIKNKKTLMSQINQIDLTPKEAKEYADNLKPDERLIKRSIDARRRGNIRVLLSIESEVDNSTPIDSGFTPRDVSDAKSAIIVGGGPAGLFAALELIERGIKPIILERGKNVRDRKKDIAAINRGEAVDPDSNYCFGEGGAGTFSDGKLYTRSKKRGDNSRILKILHANGADKSILFEAHPHIGTDKLPTVIESIRESIEKCGGEVRFGARVKELVIENKKIKGVELASGEVIEGSAVILATGHSARDIYEMLHSKEVELEAKNFAVGIRVEHLQRLIDKIQYKGERGDYLPAASYSLVAQAKGRGVYSFCMCPGGFIVPAATSDTECVVNGMSPSGRNNRFANAGIVTEVRSEDLEEYKKHFGVLAGLQFQSQLENLAYTQAGRRNNQAPAQRLTDFIKGKSSRSLGETSYVPGVVASDIHHWMPKFVGDSLREGCRLFNNKMQGFITDEAHVIGVESRTSSPVRIVRDRETFMHVSIEGLFPAGEGAGYSGGILSSAIDGMACAEKLSLFLES